jgi:pimeloyl-ACP methyl ester carboxylesterase
VDGKVPQNLDQLWGGYDPAREPLEADVCKEWEADGVVCRVVRYRVGVFKGAKSVMAAIYGFPKGGGKLPGLVQIHGGGQAANLAEVIADARRGYACISVNWGGNPLRLGDVKYDGPNTDWGTLDCTHPPQRNPKNHFAGPLAPDLYTLDAVESPRNSNWFIVLIGLRRAITFLEQQPEVDPQRIGVHGHSMGGRLTAELAGIDPRVRVAAASCGGAGVVLESEADVPGCVKKTPPPMEFACVSDNPYIARIACPILYQGPTNDFHGILDNMYHTWRNLPAERVRYAITPHMNHRHEPEFEVARLLWFEQHLKRKFALPATPKIEWTPAAGGVPAVTVTPDASLPVKRVNVYYSVMPHVLTRFWRDAGATASGDRWSAACPIMSADEPLFAFANVIYELPEPYRAAEKTDAFAISSRMLSAGPEQLKAAGAKATDKPATLIDDGSRGWHDWYQLNWGHPPLWQAVTRKMHDPKWRGPDGAHLAVDVKATGDCTLVLTFRSNDWNAFPGKPAGVYTAEKILRASDQWQTVSVGMDELLPAADKKNKSPPPLTTWQTVTEFCLSPSGAAVRDGKEVKLGGKPWQGPREFRNLRWEMPAAQR